MLLHANKYDDDIEEDMDFDEEDEELFLSMSASAIVDSMTHLKEKDKRRQKKVASRAKDTTCTTSPTSSSSRRGTLSNNQEAVQEMVLKLANLLFHHKMQEKDGWMELQKFLAWLKFFSPVSKMRTSIERGVYVRLLRSVRELIVKRYSRSSVILESSGGGGDTTTNNTAPTKPPPLLTTASSPSMASPASAASTLVSAWMNFLSASPTRLNRATSATDSEEGSPRELDLDSSGGGGGPSTPNSKRLSRAMSAGGGLAGAAAGGGGGGGSGVERELRLSDRLKDEMVKSDHVWVNLCHLVGLFEEFLLINYSKYKQNKKKLAEEEEKNAKEGTKKEKEKKEKEISPEKLEEDDMLLVDFGLVQKLLDMFDICFGEYKSYHQSALFSMFAELQVTQLKGRGIFATLMHFMLITINVSVPPSLLFVFLSLIRIFFPFLFLLLFFFLSWFNLRFSYPFLLSSPYYRNHGSCWVQRY